MEKQQKENKKMEEKIEKEEEKVIEKVKEEKTEEKKEKKPEGETKKKTSASVKGKDLGISTKHAVAICKFIKGMKIKDAISYLEEVIKQRKAIPMTGEIPHRKGIVKGKRIMSGRYPKKASQAFIKLLKSLDANAKNFGIEEPKIVLAKADKASSPYRRFGSRRFKRSHVFLVAKSERPIKLEESGEKVKV